MLQTEDIYGTLACNLVGHMDGNVSPLGWSLGWPLEHDATNNGNLVSQRDDNTRDYATGHNAVTQRLQQLDKKVDDNSAIMMDVKNMNIYIYIYIYIHMCVCVCVCIYI